jgi:hypothetical protein
VKGAIAYTTTGVRRKGCEGTPPKFAFPDRQQRVERRKEEVTRIDMLKGMFSEAGKQKPKARFTDIDIEFCANDRRHSLEADSEHVFSQTEVKISSLSHVKEQKWFIRHD